ncbi:MAG: AsnC family transcriptional regulator [Gammaproteobacteria bacterium]|jgi:Lrp/AsnC family transcriptional regulator|nr:AsnC family transcriptional regulator [Gammaproteobacteria bacterium]
MKLDRIDRHILRLLQADVTQSIQQVGDAVGLSHNACWRRIKRLEEEGVVRKRVALVDPARLGFGVTVFVTVRTSHHTEEWLDKFARGVAALPEVMEFYRISGDVDYLLKVLVADIAEYDRFYKKLIAIAPLNDVSSNFAMEQVKYSTEVPV